jgi:diguanylate cyclase (GGDEF)-like protein/PAS domain S-box-containing protein
VGRAEFMKKVSAQNGLYAGIFLWNAGWLTISPPKLSFWMYILINVILIILLDQWRRHISRLSERNFQTIFENNPNAIGIFDNQGKLLKGNARSYRLIGYKEEELRGKSLGSLLPSPFAERTHDLYNKIKDGETININTYMIHKEGFKVDLNVTIVPNGKGKKMEGFIAISQDISESKRKVEQIRHMAYYDDLTGLPNRRLFRDHLMEVLAMNDTHRQGVAVFYLDIDRFKLVNDSFGHDYGDMLLMQIAERFTHCVSESDFLARTEGDEFTFYFIGIKGAKDINLFAERIFQALEQVFIIGDYQIHITASMGVSIVSLQEKEDADTIMKYADIALSRAKEKGKNNFQIFNSDMKSISIQRLTMERELRQAINNGEFELYYQPQIDIDTHTIIGMEALVRWNHPERGLVSPGDFIPAAEENGSIVAIGEWVLTEACRQNKAWQDAGLPCIPISVNLSSRQFLQSNLLHKIQSILSQTELDPKYLELEITESMTMDVEYTTQSLIELKKLGLKISIDDFGTGYSSLSYLKMFPIDKLKIDRSFVRDMMLDPNDAAIVSTIIAMTQHMKLRVIAEGVETEEQISLLRNHKCTEVQGYWYSPPVPFDKMRNFLQKGKISAAS